MCERFIFLQKVFCVQTLISSYFSLISQPPSSRLFYFSFVMALRTWMSNTPTSVSVIYFAFFSLRSSLILYFSMSVITHSIYILIPLSSLYHPLPYVLDLTLLSNVLASISFLQYFPLNTFYYPHFNCSVHLLYFGNVWFCFFGVCYYGSNHWLI